MKIWDDLTDEAQDAILIAAFIVEAFFLFGVAA